MVHEYLEFYMNPNSVKKIIILDTRYPTKKDFSPNLIDIGIKDFLKTTTKIYNLYVNKK